MKVIRAYLDQVPQIAPGVFVAENAAVAGEVILAKDVSIWFGAALRGDEDRITVGEGSNVQDNATLHTGRDLPLRIGKGVTVGHNAVVHGCTLEDDVLVGMGAVILNGAVVGEGSIIGAGALVKEGTVIPPRSLCVGVPCRVVRELNEDAVEGNRKNALEYQKLGREYRQ